MLTVSLTPENVRKVEQIAIRHGLRMSDTVEAYWASQPQVPERLEGFAFRLKGYQRDAVRWLERQGGCGLLGDDMGLGKSCMTMAYAHRNQRFPMLVVVPNSLKLNWRNEIVAMTGHRYSINLVGHALNRRHTERQAQLYPNVTWSKQPTPGCDIYIVNYDIVDRNLKTLADLNCEFMVVDESHKIKNNRAKRTAAVIALKTGEREIRIKNKPLQVERIGRGIASTTFLSGTPLINRPVELFTTVNTLAGHVPQFSTFLKFAFRYCNAHKEQFGWNFSGHSNLDELHDLLNRHVMLRRLKGDVLQELPPKIYTTLPLQWDRGEYDKLAQAFEGRGDWRKGVETLVQWGGNPPTSDLPIVEMQKLREMAAYSKIASAVEWIQDFCEGGDKLVVFAHHRNMLERVRQQLEQQEEYRGQVQMIQGGMSTQDRDAAVQRFQNDPNVRVLLVSITAGGFGLTLTAASAVAFLQLPWTMGDVSQAADRVHRLGQTADTVRVFNLVAADSIEEDIAQLIMGKAAVMDSVLDGGRVVNAVDLTVQGK
jgi:SWI/SNF-related matrix-associated actin-dependent regulator of chromatin subfamily A-like protein 1